MKFASTLVKKIYEFIFIINSKTNDTLYLPQEIIKIIYSFLIKDYYANNIKNFYLHNVALEKSIQTVIRYNLIDTLNIPSNENVLGNENILENENILALEFLINSNITKKHDLNLWANILYTLSIQINRLKIRYSCYNISNKSVNGKKLTNLLDIWLQLCKKFNLKIFLETKKTQKYIRAKNILKMNNYNQYLISPIIIQPFSNNMWVNAVEANIFLQNKLY